MRIHRFNSFLFCAFLTLEMATACRKPRSESLRAGYNVPTLAYTTPACNPVQRTLELRDSSGTNVLVNCNIKDVNIKGYYNDHRHYELDAQQALILDVYFVKFNHFHSANYLIVQKAGTFYDERPNDVSITGVLAIGSSYYRLEFNGGYIHARIVNIEDAPVFVFCGVPVKCIHTTNGSVIYGKLYGSW